MLDFTDPFSESDSDDRCNIGKYFELSYKSRLYGFCAFAAIGTLLSFIGAIKLFSGNVTVFAIMYSFGSISTIFATLFLFGPMNQIKKMYSSLHRAIAVIVYFSMLVVTLIIAFTLAIPALCIFLVILQYVAYIWYTIVSIPGGQYLCELYCGSIIRV